jgi:hypothetical protein
MKSRAYLGLERTQLTRAPSEAAAASRRHAAATAIMKGLLRGVVAVGVAIAIFLTQPVPVQ